MFHACANTPTLLSQRLRSDRLVPNPLLIVGAGDFAEIACEYFRRDTDWRTVAFAVNREYIKSDSLLGLPVVAFEDCELGYPTDSHAAFVALTESKLNRNRARLFAECGRKGYKLASYASPHAVVDPETTVGDNVFIFEHNVIQRGCQIGDNTILWSGNHIGHRTRIDEHVFISSQVCVSGFCHIGAYSYFGVNSAIGDHVTIGADCTVGAGVTITENLADNSMVKSAPDSVRANLSRRFWRVK